MSLLRTRLPVSSSSFRSFSTSQCHLKPSPPSSSAPPKAHRVLTFSKKSGTSHFKTFLPVTPSLRQLRQPLSPHLHKGDPLRALTIAKRSSGGRNDQGRITIRARGGGHKRRIRLVDFMRMESGEQEVVRIEYDPGRSSHIALLKHVESGEMSYIVAVEGIREGDKVESFRGGIPERFTLKAGGEKESEGHRHEGLENRQTVEALLEGPQTVLEPTLPGLTPPSAPPTTTISSTPQIDLSLLRSHAIRPGNFLPLRLLPLGTVISSITLSPTGPSILCRSAGTSGRIISLSSSGGKHAQVKLGSGEVRLVGLECFAVVGENSNRDHGNRNLGKAGRMRWLGFRPQSRGVAMNATDHPHGGGRGKSKGNRNPVDEWGNSAKGVRTRSPNSKNGNKAVLVSRKGEKGKGR